MVVKKAFLCTQYNKQMATPGDISPKRPRDDSVMEAEDEGTEHHDIPDIAPPDGPSKAPLQTRADSILFPVKNSNGDIGICFSSGESDHQKKRELCQNMGVHTRVAFHKMTGEYFRLLHTLKVNYPGVALDVGKQIKAMDEIKAAMFEMILACEMGALNADLSKTTTG